MTHATRCHLSVSVPGFHKTFNKWIERQPKDEPLNFGLLDRYDDPDFPVVNIAGNKGDFLLWHSFLPHSNGTNYGEKPRMCQYITMWPADLSYWPTYRTTGDTRKQEPSAMLTDVPPSWMTVTADDGSHPEVDQATLARAVYEEERQRRLKAWSERYPGGCYTWPPVRPHSIDLILLSTVRFCRPVLRQQYCSDCWSTFCWSR